MSAIEPSGDDRTHALESRSAAALRPADLEANERALAAPHSADEGARVALLCFRAAGERFAVPAACVDRVIAPQPLRRVPHRRHPAFRGLVAHEGEILPLGSLERLLDLPETAHVADSSARMLAIGPAGRAWVFEVRSVDGVVTVPEQALRPAPVTLARGLGAATRMLARLPDGGEAAVLDPETLRTGWEAASR